MHARWWRLDPGGALVGLLAAALSMTPSLLPRPALFQGIITAFAFLIGYGIGAGVWWLVRRFVHWRPSPEGRRVAWWVYIGVAVLLAIVLAVASVAWQNEVRNTVELPEIDGFDGLVFIAGFVPVVLIGLALARAEHRMGARLMARFGRGWGATLATAIVVGSTVAVVSVVMFGLDRLYLANNGPAERKALIGSVTHGAAGPLFAR